MKKLARKNILNLMPYQPGRPISEVKRKYKLKEVIKLASNENPLGPSPRSVSAIRKMVVDVNLYPDGGCFYLKRKLAKKLKVSSKNIALGNGSNEIIELILKAFLKEGQEALMSKPDFLIYKLATLQENGIPREVPLRNFKCDLEALKKRINKKTKLIFIANPNNPVGSYVTNKELEKFFKSLPSGVIVVLDEAYSDFAKLEKDYPDGKKYINKNNIIVLRTFSKAYGLAGLRLGFAIARPFFINCLNKARQPFNVNFLAQEAALAALDDSSFIKKIQKLVKEQKGYLYKQLEKLNLEYIKSATNFVLFNVRRDGKLIFKKLLKQGVIVRDMKAYKLDNWVRVTVGRPEENKKFIKALKKVLKRG